MKIKEGFVGKPWSEDELWTPWIKKDIDYILGKTFYTENRLASARRFSV